MISCMISKNYSTAKFSTVLSIASLAVIIAAPCFAQTQDQAAMQRQQKIDANKGKRTRPVPPPFQQLTFGNWHISEKIPANWPLPIYTSRVVKTGFINPVKGSFTANAHIETQDAPQTVYDWYRNELQRRNWSIAAPTDKVKELNKTKIAKESFYFSAVSGSQTAQVTCRPGPNRVGTSLDILWMSKDRIN